MPFPAQRVVETIKALNVAYEGLEAQSRDVPASAYLNARAMALIDQAVRILAPDLGTPEFAAAAKMLEALGPFDANVERAKAGL